MKRFILFAIMTQWQVLAATFPAASAQQSAVAAAYALASDGDTVTIPAGTGTDWTTTFVITRAIVLQGAGVGQTIIQDKVSTFNPLINITLVSNLPTRVTGIEIVNVSGDTLVPRIRISGTNIDPRTIRVDNCKFNELSASVFSLYTCIGVIDNNIIIGRSGVQVFIGFVYGSSWGVAADLPQWGDGAWAEADNLGTDKFIFFETNTISNVSATPLTGIDGHSGARYVFRYNASAQGAQTEMHGPEAARTRGGRAMEIYNNSFVGNDTRATPIYFRGGTGVVHNNTFTGWTTGANLALLYFRSTTQGFSPMWGADGRNPWDSNNPSNPFDTGTVDSAGTLTVTDTGQGWTTNQWAGYTIRKTSGTAVTSINRSGSVLTVVATAHGYTTGDYVSIYDSNQQPYNGLFLATVTDANTFTVTSDVITGVTTPATGTIKTCAKQNYAEIDSNTSDTITYHTSGFGSLFDMTFAAGNTFEINKVDRAMDQPGAGIGSNVGGTDVPSPPVGWNDQATSPWYEWNNTREGAADVSFTNARNEGGTYAVIVPGVDYINNTSKPGYTPYTYPHPLVTGAANTIAVSGTTTVTGTLTLP